MGQAIIYCSTCGEQIHDKDLQSGKAVALLDKTFCDDCKEEVFAQLRGDEPDSKMMPATTKSHAAAPHPKHFDKGKPAAQELPQPAAPRKGVKSFYIAIAGVAIAILGLILFLIPHPPATQTSEKPKVKSTDGDTGQAGNRGEQPTPEPPEQKPIEPPVVKPQPTDTTQPANPPIPQPPAVNWEEKIRPLLKKAEELIAKDKDWANFLEIRKTIDEAAELATSKHPSLTKDVDKLKEKYLEPYEKEAQKWLDHVKEYVSLLEREKHFAQAAVYLKAMPRKYEHSAAWIEADFWRERLENLDALK